MSFDISALVEDLAGQGLRDYQRRAQVAVRSLAQAAGLDGDHETQRFSHIMEQLRAGVHQPSQTDGLAALQAVVVEQMPNVVELVMTYAAGTYRGFGYLSEGKPRGSLPETLRFQLENGLRCYLSHGGAMADAGVLADVFALIFPNIEALAEHSGMAQAMLLGFVPTAEGLGMKVYFNTKLLGGKSHRTRVVAFMDYLGLDGAKHYDALHDSFDGLSFAGVGLDLDGGPVRRAKLYIRVERGGLESHLPRLLETMGLDASAGALGVAQGLLKGTEGEAATDDVELAIGLSGQGYQTLKLTTFFLDSSQSEEPTIQVASYLRANGYEPKAFVEAVGILSERVTEPGVKKQPVHALGIEYPVGESPKVNVYLTPLL